MAVAVAVAVVAGLLLLLLLVGVVGLQIPCIEMFSQGQARDGHIGYLKVARHSVGEVCACYSVCFYPYTSRA